MTTLTIISIGVSAAALALLSLGLRGKRLDRLPRCRTCGYDVSGIEGACPECGRLLGGRFSIKRGAHRRRPVLIALGLLLLLSLSLPGYWWWTGRDAHAARPTWRLLLEARSETEPEAPAIDELMARWDDAVLSQEAINQLASMVSRAWDSGEPGSALRRQDVFERCLISASFSDDQLRLAFDGAMRDLSNDDVWGNAAQGERLIRTLGTPAIEQLPRFLHATDRQQALRAARLLSWYDREPHEARLTELAIDSLRDDEHHGNLGWAQGYLWSHAGSGAIERLTLSINDPDAQLRVHARELLVPITCRTGAPPSGDVLDAWIGMLRTGAEGRVGVATRGLVHHASLAEPKLRAALATSDDPQQRFIAAYALGMGGLGSQGVLATLIDHLGDNEVSGDAARAAAALFHLGELARPALLLARDDADPQRVRHAKDILWAMSLPESPAHTYTREDPWRVSQLWFPEPAEP